MPQTRISIDLGASPSNTHGTTDLDVDPDGQPSSEILDLTWSTARLFIERIGDAADSVAILEFTFQRGHHPDQLMLKYSMQVPLPASKPLTIEGYYRVGLAQSLGQPIDGVDDELLESLRDDLARGIQTAASEQHLAADQLQGLLKSTGLPEEY